MSSAPYGEPRSPSTRFLPPDPKVQEPYRLRPGLALRVGVLGDSYADEYQFSADDRAGARNFVEQLAQSRGVNFGALASDPRPAPRLNGFEFNWGQSGATSSDMISNGQHTGLAAQAAAGLVSHALIFIGGNDLGAVFDAQDHVIATIAIPFDPLDPWGTAFPFGLAVSPDQSRVYVGTMDGRGKVFAIDTETLTLRTSETIRISARRARWPSFTAPQYRRSSVSCASGPRPLLIDRLPRSKNGSPMPAYS